MSAGEKGIEAQAAAWISEHREEVDGWLEKARSAAE